MLWLAAIPIVLAAWACASIPASAAPVLGPVREAHPRLVFTPDNEAALAARYREHPLYPILVGRVRRRVPESALSVAGARALRDLAFVYRVSGDVALGQSGAEALQQAIARILDGAYEQRDDQSQSIILSNLAWAYDWLYDRLSPDGRRAGAEALMWLVRYGKEHFPFNYTPGTMAAFNNHAAQAVAAHALAGLAAAGEHPEALAEARWAYTQFLDVFFPVMDLVAGSEGIWNEGTHYNMVMLKPLFYFMDAVRSATGEDLYQTAAWLESTSLYWPYLTQPDGTLVMLGDWWYDPATPDLYPNLYSRIFAPIAKAATEHRNPYLQAYARWLLPRVIAPQLEPWHITWYDPDLPDRPLSELPPSRLFHGDPAHGGEELVVLRSGWDPDATVITLAGGDWFGHHDHYNAAAFTLFHRGDLAIDPGYDGESIRDWQFFRRTIAHNTIVVDAPGAGGELTDHPWGFEGGQRVPILTDRPRNVDQYFRLRNPEYPAESLFETGSVVAFETSDRFDYAAVDATRAYERSQLTAFVRHLVFIKPDLVLVYDVIHTPPGRSPRWLLQSVHPPHLSQGSFSVANGGGALEAAVLLPVAARVTSLPTPAGYRTEVAGEPAAEHRFLVVIRAGERGAVAPVVARAERVSDALIVQVEPSGPDHPGASVTFRWDGRPGVEVRLGG